MRQIKKLQKEAGREQKGPITETFAQRQFTFYQVRAKSFLGLKTAKAQESKYHLINACFDQNGTVAVSLDVCEPECFTDRAFFEGEIDEQIFNEIFPQVRWQYSYKW